jgi:hypothetical protein
VVSFTLRQIYTHRKSPGTLGYEVGWASKPVWKQRWRRKKKKILFLPGNEPRSSSSNPVISMAGEITIEYNMKSIHGIGL